MSEDQTGTKSVSFDKEIFKEEPGYRYETLELFREWLVTKRTKIHLVDEKDNKETTFIFRVESVHLFII